MYVKNVVVSHPEGVYTILMNPAFLSMVITWWGLQGLAKISHVWTVIMWCHHAPEAFIQESISLGRLTGKSTLLQVDRMDWLTGSLFCLSAKNCREIEHCPAVKTIRKTFQNDPPPITKNTHLHTFISFHTEKTWAHPVSVIAEKQSHKS